MDTTREAASALGPSAILLCALSFFIIAAPILRHSGIPPLVVSIGTSIVLLAAVYSAHGKRSHLIVASCLAFPALVLQLETPLFGTSTATYPRLLCTAALLFYASTLILIALMRQTRVSGDTVIGGINIYLLLIIGFTFLHAIAELQTPGAYMIGGQSVGEAFGEIPHGDSVQNLLYFSTVTMTTLGYGDVAPAAPTSRTLCAVQAIIGQLYVAIFIARLVALHIAHNSNRGTET